MLFSEHSKNILFPPIQLTNSNLNKTCNTRLLSPIFRSLSVKGAQSVCGRILCALPMNCRATLIASKTNPTRKREYRCVKTNDKQHTEAARNISLSLSLMWDKQYCESAICNDRIPSIIAKIWAQDVTFPTRCTCSMGV